LQRLTALKKFLNNELAVFGGYYLTDFEDSKSVLYQAGYLSLNVNNLQSKGEVLCWYLEMNSGGTPHTKSELQQVQAMIDKINQEN